LFKMLHKNSAMHDKMVAPDRQMQNVEGRLLHGNQFRTCNLAPSLLRTEQT
jgi:hypothetical protein